MKKSLADLAVHRRVLLDRIEAQRMDVAEISRHFKSPLALADTGLNVVRHLKSHPALLIGGLAGLLALRRGSIIGLAQAGWRVLYRYSSPVFYGLKWLYLAVRSPSTEGETEAHPG